MLCTNRGASATTTRIVFHYIRRACYVIAFVCLSFHRITQKVVDEFLFGRVGCVTSDILVVWSPWITAGIQEVFNGISTTAGYGNFL